ncbi:MAG: PIN domain-containing protein [Verrucomicrobiota bacterium]
MRIYADTSFLVALLYPPDAGHDAAMAEFKKHFNAEWITSDWSQFETGNSLRQLCVQNQKLNPDVPEALRRYFKHLHRVGPFSLNMVDWQELLKDSHQISAACGNSIVARSADLLHVAALEQITPDLFITRDKKQHELAVARAFASQLVDVLPSPRKCIG